MSSPSGVRYCPSCGQPTTFDKNSCPRCGNPLPAMPVTAAPQGYGAPGGGMPPPAKGGMPGWVLGVIGCVVAAPILVAVFGVLAAIAIPGFLRYEANAKSMAVETNLKAIWNAEKAYAEAHDGDYSEFDIDETDQEDPGFTALSVTLTKPLHHGYSAYYLGGTLWITASGNVDEDATADEWELSSDDPTPFHYSNDVNEEILASRQPTDEDDDEEYEGTSEGEEGGVEGGVVGGVVGGVPSMETLDRQLALQRQSETARGNLEAIWKAEQAWKVKHRTYMAFNEGNSTTWTALGVKLPDEAHHDYSAKLTPDGLVLTATANLDDDEFEDVWRLESKRGYALQDKNDALNLDLTALSTSLKKGG